MEKKNLLITLGTIFAIVATIAIYGASISPKQNSGEFDTFAGCLTEKGAKFYGAFWCSHCATQKKMFGKSFEKINYVECSSPDGKDQTTACKEAGIKGYPTWEFVDGSRVEGEVTPEVLSQKTGCQLPQ